MHPFISSSPARDKPASIRGCPAIRSKHRQSSSVQTIPILTGTSKVRKMNIRVANQSHINPARIALPALVLLSGSAAQAQAPNPSTVSVHVQRHDCGVLLRLFTIPPSLALREFRFIHTHDFEFLDERFFWKRLIKVNDNQNSRHERGGSEIIKRRQVHEK